MTKLEETDKWPKILQRADEGKSLREIAEEVGATPGAVNAALKRTDTPKAPAPPGPRARRGASPPPVKAPKVPKVKGEKQPRQKAPKAVKPKTFPEVIGGVLEEFGFDAENLNDPVSVGQALRSVFVSLGLTPKDNLADTDDCDENAESDNVSSLSTVNDPDSSGEDDNGDCDGEANTDEVVPSVSGDFDGLNVVGLPVVTFGADSQPSVVGEVTAQTVNEDGGLSVQIAVDPNEVTLRGEVIDDWGTPPSFTIPSDEELASMNRDDLRKLAANPACRDAFVLKGYSKMSPESLRKALAQVRNDS